MNYQHSKDQDAQDRALEAKLAARRQERADTTIGKAESTQEIPDEVSQGVHIPETKKVIGANLNSQVAVTAPQPEFSEDSTYYISCAGRRGWYVVPKDDGNVAGMQGTPGPECAFKLKKLDDGTYSISANRGYYL